MTIAHATIILKDADGTRHTFEVTNVNKVLLDKFNIIGDGPERLVCWLGDRTLLLGGEVLAYSREEPPRSHP